MATPLDRYWGRRRYQAAGRLWLDAALEQVAATTDAQMQRLRASALMADGARLITIGGDDTAFSAMRLAAALPHKRGSAPK